MINFEDTKKLGRLLEKLNTEQLQMLTEMSANDARKMLLSAIPSASDEDIMRLASAYQEPLIKAKLVELFQARKLDSYIDNAAVFGAFTNMLTKANTSPTDTIDFIEQCIKGTLFDHKAFTKSPSGNLKSFVKSHPVMDKVFKDLVMWAPPMDVTGVGAGEAFLIFTAADGQKGGDKGGGDAYCAGTLIEIKSNGGVMGEAPANIESWYISTVKAMAPSLAKKSNSEITKMSFFAKGDHKTKSQAINNLGLLLRSVGKTDAEIEQFHRDCIQKLSGTSLNNLPVVVKRGVTQYHSLLKYYYACAFEAYKGQTGFGMLTLFNKENFDFVNFRSAKEVYDNNSFKPKNNFDFSGSTVRNKGISGQLETHLSGYVASTVLSDESEKTLKERRKAWEDFSKKLEKAQQKGANEKTIKELHDLIDKTLKTSSFFPLSAMVSDQSFRNQNVRAIIQKADDVGLPKVKAELHKAVDEIPLIGGQDRSASRSANRAAPRSRSSSQSRSQNISERDALKMWSDAARQMKSQGADSRKLAQTKNKAIKDIQSGLTPEEAINRNL